MVNRKISKRAVPTKKQSSGGTARTKAAPVRSAAAKPTATAKTRPTVSKPTKSAAAKTKLTKTKLEITRPTKSAAAGTPTGRAAPAKRTLAKAPATKATPHRGAMVKATPAKTPRASLPAPTRQPASPARVAPAPRDATREKIQVLEQEKSELQNLCNQMRAELDSALAEAERLREHLRDHVRDLESTQMRQTAAEPRPASPGGFDPAADLDEDIPAVPDDDLEETAGFFDRMDEIRARRNELDRERNDRELEQSDQPFWMICPKCGDLMEESEGENVKLERCENCGGLYLDRGEVDLILSLCAGPDAYRRLHNIMKF